MQYAVFAAEQVIDKFEKEYPNDTLLQDKLGELQKKLNHDQTTPVKSPDYGGIDLEKVNVKSSGGGVRTAFSNPQIMRMLSNADGLIPVIYSIKPISSTMTSGLLGIS